MDIKLIFDYFFSLIQAISLGWLTAKYIAADRPARFTAIYGILLTAQYIVFSTVPVFVQNYRSITMCLTQIILILCCTKISKLHTILYYLVTMIFVVMFEIVYENFFYYVFKVNITEITTLAKMSGVSPLLALAASLLYLFVYIASILSAYLLCRRFFVKGDPAEDSRFLPVLIMEAFMVLILTAVVMSRTENYFLVCCTLLIYLVFLVLIDLFLLRMLNQLSAAHKSALNALAERAQLQAQLSYFAQITENTKVIRKLSHDVNNQLQTVSFLLNEHKYQDAEKQLRDFESKFAQAVSHIFTGNTLVDAILSQKQQICLENNITMECNGTLPETLPLDSSALCSIVANLIDNAISACISKPTTAILQFDVELSSSQLRFCCKNPAVSDAEISRIEPSISNDHGWGLSILSSIAEKHHGDFNIRNDGTTVTAILWIPIS